jgi:hypothetical protein
MTNWRERIEEIVNDASGKLSNEEWVEKYGDVKYYELIESLIREAQAQAWEIGFDARDHLADNKPIFDKSDNPYLESEE